MRGRSSLWYRVRVNLIHVPEAERPAQEPLESDFDPWANMDIEAWKAATAGSRARRPTPKSKPPDAGVGVTSRAEGAGKDWIAWHADYDADTPLHHRLLAVQRRIREALTDRPPGSIRVVSACAGEGRDLLGAMVDHPRAIDVHGRLVELDRELAARAAAQAPPGIDVVCADAGSTDAYVGAVPADLVLVCGVFGNTSDGDVEPDDRRPADALCFRRDGHLDAASTPTRPDDRHPALVRGRRIRASGIRCARRVRVERRRPALRRRSGTDRPGSSAVQLRHEFAEHQPAVLTTDVSRARQWPPPPPASADPSGARRHRSTARAADRQP